MLGFDSYAQKGFRIEASGFKQAMHGSCLTCHRLRQELKKEDPAKATSRGNCLFCHRDWADPGMFKDEKDELARQDARSLSPSPRR